MLAEPLVVALSIAALAAALRLRRKPRAAAWVIIAAALVAYLGSLTAVGDLLLQPLEQQYAPLRDDSADLAGKPVVVLGTGYSPRGAIPVTAALAEDGLVRIVEGVRLARRFHSPRLIVSGGAPPGSTASAVGYARLASELGIDDNSIVVLDKGLDTAAEAREIARTLGSAEFVLVTSAYHMPRAMKLMLRAGCRPIAAPTGQQVGQPRVTPITGLLPTSVGLRKSERALHEYLGLTALAARLD